MAKYSSDNHIIYVLSNDSNVEVSGKADVAAEFKGGNTALYNYVAGQLKVPGWFRKAGRNGIVKVRMLVNKDGRILDTSIKEGLPDCPDCEKEAMRLVQHMPPWKPAESGGRRVNMYFLLPIPFR